MTVATSPTQDDLFVALQTFLVGILPANTPVILGQVNRVGEPPQGNFVAMWEIRRLRLATNIDEYIDATFTASIAGTVMTVADLATGTIGIGNRVFGTGLASGTTTIVSQISGISGGAGTYRVSLSQTAASQAMAAGSATFTQKVQSTVQLDVHGPNGANNSNVISTLFRDAYAVEQFAESGFDVVPLYADDPRQMPFLNAQQQYEDRWVIEANLQLNEIVTGVSQQFADAITVAIRSVDAEFPAV